ncbi:MAG: hypothetical protein ACXWCU_00385, partial [Caldimonas sp.]
MAFHACVTVFMLAPLVIVCLVAFTPENTLSIPWRSPTKYYTVPTQHWRDQKVSLIIWANHNMRAAVQSMQAVSKKIFEEQSLVNVEKNVATVNEV